MHLAPYLLTACLAAPTAPAGDVPIAGTWQYTGQYTAGPGRTIAGTLIVRSQSSVTYDGEASFVESGADALPLRQSGSIAGRMASATTVDFSITTGAGARQHLARWTHDTLIGTWFELGTSGLVTGSGSFRAVRSARP